MKQRTKYFDAFLFIIFAFSSLMSCKKESAEEDLPSNEPHIAVQWAKQISSDFLWGSNVCLINADGNLAVCYSYIVGTPPNCNYNVKLVIFDSDGNQQTSVDILNGLTTGPSINSIIPTSDHGYVIMIYSSDGLQPYWKIIKIDGNGSELWKKDFVLGNHGALNSVMEQNNSDLYLIGRDSLQKFMLKMNAAGDILDTVILHQSFDITMADQLYNDNIFIAGDLYHDDYDYLTGFASVINDTAGVIWQQELLSNYHLDILSMACLYVNPDNSIVVMGNCGGYTETLRHSLLFAKFSPDGELLNTSYTGIPYGCYDIYPATGGGYLILTHMYQEIAKLSETGDLVWCEAIPGIESVIPSSLAKDGGFYYAFGFSNHNEGGHFYPWLIKFSI